MVDLPANVKFDANDDGWTLDRSGESIRSVQAFRDGGQIIIELWGTTTVVSPAGKRYENHEFQQNSWIESNLDWRALRVVYNVADDTHYVNDGVTFERHGTATDIPRARRI